ncbi:MAG: glycogen synthase, partial [Chloroflexota bacterium]|nr:glycogen synthase [Chloroflexota bacterium]
MKVLLCAAEAAPLVKVGGLGDVVGALPAALAARGHDARVMLPAYHSISEGGHPLRPTGVTFPVQVRGRQHQVALLETTLPSGAPAYLLDCPPFFRRPRIYGEPDDLDRFLCFSRGALEAIGRLGWQPDVVHAHDWHAALIVSFLRTELARRMPYSSIGTVLTIHNLAYQGWFDYAWAGEAGLRPQVPGVENPLHPLLWRCLALGIYYADAVTTVSETYAREILTPQYGEGLDPLLRHRQRSLVGIINGVDYQVFDPARDPQLPVHYSANEMAGKARVKAALQERLGLPVERDTPVVANVGRLAYMKGGELTARAVAALLDEGALLQFVQLGSGEPEFEAMMTGLAQRYPGRVAVALGRDHGLASLVYAGSDLFVMPSRFEPCGLGQLIALRYGSIPVVRRTGGLADTVSEGPQTGNGFVFRAATPEALVAALQRALDAYADRAAWRRLVERAMRCEYTWDAS